MPPHFTVFVDTLESLNENLQDISPVGKLAAEELAVDMDSEGVGLCHDTADPCQSVNHRLCY